MLENNSVDVAMKNSSEMTWKWRQVPVAYPQSAFLLLWAEYSRCLDWRWSSVHVYKSPDVPGYQRNYLQCSLQYLRWSHVAASFNNRQLLLKYCYSIIKVVNLQWKLERTYWFSAKSMASTSFDFILPKCMHWSQSGWDNLQAENLFRRPSTAQVIDFSFNILTKCVFVTERRETTEFEESFLLRRRIGRQEPMMLTHFLIYTNVHYYRLTPACGPTLDYFRDVYFSKSSHHLG